MNVVGTLDPEDLNRYRAKRAMLDALEINPSVFDKDATYKVVFDHYRIAGELADKYNLGVMADIDPVTGICTIEYGLEME